MKRKSANMHLYKRTNLGINLLQNGAFSTQEMSKIAKLKKKPINKSRSELANFSPYQSNNLKHLNSPTIQILFFAVKNYIVHREIYQNGKQFIKGKILKA